MKLIEMLSREYARQTHHMASIIQVEQKKAFVDGFKEARAIAASRLILVDAGQLTLREAFYALLALGEDEVEDET